MKRIITTALALVMVLAAAQTVMANPGRNPNQNPGGPSITVGDVMITVTGGGNNLVIEAEFIPTGRTEIIHRQGNGTFQQTFEVFGRDIAISVRGNSLISAQNATWEDAVRAYSRYTTYVHVWNQLWTGAWFEGQYTGAQFLADEGGLAHYYALCETYQVKDPPPFFAFDASAAADFDGWANLLEVGLLRVYNIEQLQEMVRSGNYNSVITAG